MTAERGAAIRYVHVISSQVSDIYHMCQIEPTDTQTASQRLPPAYTMAYTSSFRLRLLDGALLPRGGVPNSRMLSSTSSATRPILFLNC